MKSLSTCFYIILITWRIVNCEDDYAEDTSEVDFPKNTENMEFVDPHSFEYDRANKKMRDRQSVGFAQSDKICVTNDQCRKELKQCREALDSIEFDRLYATRLINLLLSSAKLQEEGDWLTGSITLSGTKAQIKELRGFADGEITMQQVDAILSEIITPTINIFTETLTLIDHLRLTIYQHGKIYTAVLATLVTLFSIKFVNWSTGKVIIVFAAGVFFISFFMMWSQLIKEAELKQLVASIKHKKPPIQCEPEKMYFWDRMVTYFDADDQCFEYYKAIEFDAFHEVTAIDALVEVFDRLALQPTARIGTVIGHFIENLTKPLPLILRWPVTILLYIGVVLTIMMLFLTISGGRFSLWGPLIGISVGGRQANRDQQQPRLMEQREPIIHIAPVILERNSDGELRQLVSTAVTQASVSHTTDQKKPAIGAGDSEMQNQEAKRENSAVICSSCCCKNSLNQSHVQEDRESENEPKKTEVRSEEKGDGDS